MNVFPNILTKYKSKFQKTETEFCRWKSTDNNDINYPSCHWKMVVSFYLRKKKPENGFLTLIVKYRKMVQKNKTNYAIQNNKLVS